MTHFIDSLVAEYKANQKALLTTHQAPPSAFVRPAKKQKAPSTVANVAQQMLESLVHGNFTLAIQVKAEKKPLLPTQYEEEPAYFYLNLPHPLWESVGQLKQIYSQKITPLITSQHQAEKIVALGELLLQGFVSQPPGTHLVVAPSSSIPTLHHLLTLEVFPRGMKTAWELWNQVKPIDQNRRFEIFSELMQCACAKSSKDMAFDDSSIAAILSLMNSISAGVVHEQAKNKPWFTANLLKKLHPLTKTHLEKINRYVELGEDESLAFGDVCEAIDKVLRYLPDDPLPLLVTFKANLNNLSKAIDDPNISLSQLNKGVLDCYVEPFLASNEPSHYPLIIAHYLLTAAILDSDPRKWPIQRQESYPKFEQYSRLLFFSEHQVQCARDKETLSHFTQDSFSNSKSTVLITTAEALEQIPLERTIRSIHFFDIPSLTKTATLGQRLITSQAQKYPQDPCPLSAIYCSAIDQIKNGYILI